jgi:hypothetical protein
MSAPFEKDTYVTQREKPCEPELKRGVMQKKQKNTKNCHKINKIQERDMQETS